MSEHEQHYERVSGDEVDGGLSHRINFYFGKLQFGSAKRLEFYRKLHAMLKNNMPTATALATIEDITSLQGKRPYESEALMAQHMRRKVLEGANLAEAMEGWVPHRDVMMMRTAEFGTPIKPLESMIGVTQAMAKIRSTFVGQLVYPLVVIAVAFVALVGVSTQIVPAFLDIAPNVEWQGVPYYFVNMTDHIANYWHYWIIGIVAVIAVIAGTMPYWTGSIRKFFDKIPPWSIYRLWNGAGWLLSFSSMISAGLAELDALYRIEEQAPPWLKERNEAIRQEVANGQDIGDALASTGFDFPDFEVNLLIAVYARLSSAGEALERVAEEWVENSEKRMANAASLLRIFSLLFAAGVIAGSVASIYQMEQQIVSSLGV